MEWKSFKQAYITLIYKKSDPTDIRNYRPISLLNVDYKIVSKVYANHISAVLSELLGPMQYAFKGRDVCDGLIFLRDVIDLIQTKKQDAYVLSISFYIAFDCVDHIFLKKVLKCSCFSGIFCDRIFALFQNSETAVIVNGFINNFLPINRVVRQGDPLSLYLFLVFIEPMFRSVISNYLIDGIFIPASNAFAMKYFAYADDVTSMSLEIFSVSKAFDLLLKYEMASGLKINFKKSKGFFCCKDQTPTFNSDVLKQLKWRSDFIDILNIPFGSKQEISRVFSAKISSVKNEVYCQPQEHSTFDAKSVIVKIKILPLLSSFSQVYIFPKLHDF